VNESRADPVRRRLGIRGRLVVAFILIAGISAGALALGSYLLVREARLAGSLDLARERARTDLRLASGITAREVTPGGFLQGYEQDGAHAVLAFPGRAAVASDPAVNPALPASLRGLVRAGQLGYARLTVAGAPYLVIGGKVPRSAGSLYLFFPESALASYLGQLSTVLLAAWLAVLAAAGLTGRLLARRTLEPVARASAAARSMAGGELATRLPVLGPDEFGDWAASFNELADVVQRQIAALSAAQARERQFTSDVAHELRTPLTTLVAEASELRDKLARMPPDARRPTELMIWDVTRLRTLVEELTEVSRLDAGMEPVAPALVGVRSAAAAILASRGWAGQVVFEGEDATVRTDPRRLERILANLIGNAVEHGGGHGVRVTCASAGGAVTVEVSDAGPGIAPEHLPHVFERFYKADSSRSAAGSGLGLAIALENARLLGGELTASSPLALGARFRLTLPAALGGGGAAPDGAAAGGADVSAQVSER
jgi:two-component system sensor histidine kinase MtrB